MDSQRYRRVRAIFEQAIEVPAEQREAFLDKTCGDDTEVRREVERLLLYDAPGSAGAPTVLEDLESGAARQIGPYRLIRKLGEAGMGVVWEARQDHPVERTVAIKQIKQGLDGGQVLARFESERQALALMNHPNVARVLDAGTDDAGQPWFAMECIRGVPITEYCDRHNLSTSERLQLLTQVCEGVQHAHQKGIIHRDIKPSNVLVELQDGRPVPKIIDFGVAKALERRLTERTLFTEFGQIVGTPEYMSPEQAEMTGLDIDTRTDVYSLGVMLYELLTGSLPFSSKELRQGAYDEIRRKIREETPPKPSTRLSTQGDQSAKAARHRGADVPTLARICRGDLDWITMKALEKDRGRRYGAASELAADLRRHLANEPVSAGPPSAVYRLQKFVRRHRFGVGMTTVLAASVLAGFIGTAYGLVRARVAEQKARTEAETLAEVSDFTTGMFQQSDPSEARGAAVTVREVLDRGRADIANLSRQPTVQARMMEVMGRVYRNLGLYRDAQPVLEQAVRAARPDTLELAQSLTTLATIAILRGAPEEAEPLLVRAREVQDRILPADHPARFDVLNNLGNVWRLRKRWPEAQAFYEQALALRRSRPELWEDLDTAKILGQIGWAQMRSDHFDQARETFGQSLAMYEKLRGTDSPILVPSLAYVAQNEHRAQHFEAARAALNRALAIQEKTLAPTHPDLVNTLLERGLLEQDAGDLEAARAAVARAMPIALGPPEHRLLKRLRELEAALR